MRRSKEPWFREFNQTWYVKIDGQQIPLAKGKENKSEAVRAFHKLMASDNPIPSKPNRVLVMTILDLFLDHSKRHNKEVTYEWYKNFLQDFSNKHGKKSVESLKPFHVTQWLDAHPDWKNSNRSAITAIKRAFNWAVDEGLIETNPVKKVKKPPAQRRERLITTEEQEMLFNHFSEGDCFRDYLTALRESGARPGEISMVTVENVDLDQGIWILPEHKTKGKIQRPRIIYLTPVLLELTRSLMERHKTGLLFRDSKGNAWNKNSIGLRIRRARKKLNLGDDFVAYLYRHGFATEALTNGVSVAAVAELLGHTDLQMVAQHYSHLSQQKQHLREMAKKAREG